jgi:hypothetical protein
MSVRDVEPPVNGLGGETGEHLAQLPFVAGRCDAYRNHTPISLDDFTLRMDMRPLTVGSSYSFMHQILHVDLFSLSVPDLLYKDCGRNSE